jgi:hypothetical protein
MREKIARACSIPQHHTAWDTLTWQEKALFYMQADHVLALYAPVIEENERYRLALEPFAAFYSLNDCDERPLDGALEVPIRALRDARAALSPSEKHDG